MRKVVSKQDISVIISLLCIAALGLFIYPKITKTPDNSAKIAQVYVDNELALEIPLDTPDVIILPQNPKISFEVNGENTIAFIASNCPDQVCIRTGFLKSSGAQAVCLPNKVILTIVSNDLDDNDIDLIA